MTPRDISGEAMHRNPGQAVAPGGPGDTSPESSSQSPPTSEPSFEGTLPPELLSARSSGSPTEGLTPVLQKKRMEKANWFRFSQLAFEVLPFVMRDVFKRKWKEKYGYDWQDGVGHGRLITDGGVRVLRIEDHRGWGRSKRSALLRVPCASVVVQGCKRDTQRGHMTLKLGGTPDVVSLP